MFPLHFTRHNGAMTSTVNPLQLSLGNTSYQYRPRFINSESSVAGMDEVMADASPSPTSNLPGRLTRSATAHASNKSLPRIDTEQLRSLSLRDKVSGRRANRPSSAAVELRQQQFQKYREMLWENGRTNLGKKDTPHVKIAPVRLPTSPAPNYDSITIYTVVHSQGHSPVGLRRKFDRSLVTTTVPEPLQSPATPNFDRDELLSAIADTNKTLTAARRLKKNTRSSSVRRESRRQETPSPVPDGIPMREFPP